MLLTLVNIVYARFYFKLVFRKIYFSQSSIFTHDLISGSFLSRNSAKTLRVLVNRAMHFKKKPYNVFQAMYFKQCISSNVFQDFSNVFALFHFKLIFKQKHYLNL